MNAMSTIKKMTLEEIKNIPPMTEAERRELKNSPITYDEESPKLSKEELSQFHLAKDAQEVKRPVTLRLAEKDISALKVKADYFGLPYQTLVSSILHRFVNDELVDKEEVRKLVVMAKV